MFQPEMNDIAGQTCVHVATVLADSEVGRELIAKYKSVVAWNVNRFQPMKNPAKRRKARANSG